MKTSLTALLNIAVRLGAVLLAVSTLAALPFAVETGMQAHNWPLLTSMAIALNLLVAAALWLWPQLLVWWISGKRGHTVFEAPIDVLALQYVAFSVLGAWFVVTGLRDMLAHLINIGVINDFGATPRKLDFWYLTIRYGATILAGAALALGARGLTAWLYNLRTRNLPPSVDEESPE